MAVTTRRNGLPGADDRAQLRDGCAAPRPGTEPRGTTVQRHPLHDPAVLAEIELYGELVIAASSSDDRLDDREIDEILGLATERLEQAASPNGPASP